MSEITKTVDEKETQKTTTINKQTKTEKGKGDRSYSEMARAK